MNDEVATLEGAREQLNTLCVAVGLIRADELPSVDQKDAPPDGTTLWQSTYANVLLWPCEANCVDDIQSASRRGESWFDQVLCGQEAKRNGRVLDGYLVLALSQRPPEEARDDVRRLELSSLICRKHLIWPCAPEDQENDSRLWCRVADVTVVGLPKVAVPATGELHWPELDADAKAQFDELQQLGVPGALVKDRAQE